jgi:group I intron endonuclease
MNTSSFPVASGIYCIRHLESGKRYIGSAVNLARRQRVHLHHLRHSTHHSITLQRAWDKYGENAFSFEIVELILTPFLLEREQHWLDKFQCFNPAKGYNIDRIAGSRIGHSPSPETREKLRQANLGKKYSEETKRKHSEQGKTRTQSPETREKVRLIRLGTKRSPETCEKLRLASLGRKQSEETKEKRRISSLGKTMSEDARARIRATNAVHPSHVKRMKTLIVTSPEGEVFTIHGIGKFCKEHGLAHSALMQVAKGNVTHHKGWKARYPSD